ncbi:MAG: guanylate kinase [Lachnospiraceae bacterium]|nr:guanylate kinase [Lachnospiraceae bacterium]
MGKIFYIMGKSASGKDKIYSELLQNEKLGLKELVLYTTRPIRHGEEDGKQYYFVDDKRLNQLRNEGKIIEERAYQTVHGIWTYFTADEGQIALEQANYIGIGTLESYGKMRQYFGPEKIVPVYVEVEDGIRLERALIREKKQEQPKYKEMCRRFLADCEDFSEENIAAEKIERRFFNNGAFEDCLKEVEEFIQSMVY